MIMMPNDWRFTPVKGKRPYLDEWQKNPLTLTEAKAHKHTGIGLMLGPCSGGTMAIDFDGPEAMQFFADTIGDDVPEACMWTSLKPGRFQMAFRVPESEWPGLSTKKIGPGNKLEFRWTNAQSVIPPSWHPEMGKYEWVIEPTLENTSIVIPDNILAAWREACKPPTPKVSLNKHKYENETVTVEEVRQYLNKIITPGYDDWIRLTWACVNVLGKVDGIALMKECFPEEVAGEYDKLEKTYREAPSEGVCGMGTIVHMAGGRIDNRPDADARQRIKDRYYAQKKQTVKQNDRIGNKIMSENFLKLLEKWQQYPVDYETNDRKEIDALTTSAFVWCKVEDNEDQTMIDVLDAILENHTKMKAAQRTKIIRDLRLTLEYKVTPKTYREFMSAWSQKFQANITLDRQFSLMGEESDDGAIFNAVFLKAGEHGVFAAKEQLKAAYNDWKVGCEKANKAAFIKRIEYSPNANVNVWDEFINSFLRDDHIPNEEDRVKYRKMVKAVLMGFVWRIKNKMLGRPTSNHIMAYFRSKQGAGKTNMMKWFLDPVDDGTTWTTFEMFDHDEKQNQLRHSPVIVMDEMAKAEKTDSGKLKNMMTADFTSFRKLYGEAGKGRVLSTLLGAGNFDLTEILPDTSGLRRFFQIEVFKDFWKRDVQYDHLDALDLWKSVDENAVSPIETADMIEMLIEYQGQHKTKSPIEDWLDHVCENGKFAHVDKKNGVETAYYYEATDLFSDYKIWATSRFPNDRSNQLSFTRALGRILRDGEWAYDTHNDNKTRRVCYRIGHHVEGKTDMTGKILPFMSPQTITGFAIEK